MNSGIFGGEAGEAIDARMDGANTSACLLWRVETYLRAQTEANLGSRRHAMLMVLASEIQLKFNRKPQHLMKFCGFKYP